MFKHRKYIGSKKAIFLALSFFFLFLGLSESYGEDQNQKSPQPIDTAHIQQLIQQGDSLRKIQIPESLPFLLEAFALSTKAAYNDGLIQAGKSLALAYRDLLDTPKALKYALEVMKIMEQNQQTEDLPSIYGLIVRIYHRSKEFDLAYEYIQKIIEIHERNGTPEKAMGAYINLGTILMSKGDFESALRIFLENLEEIEKSEHEIWIAATRNSMGRCYFGLEAYEDAAENYKLASEINRQTNNRKALEMNMQNIGEAYVFLGRYQEAEEILLTSLQYADSVAFLGFQIDARQRLSTLYSKQGKYEEAFPYMKEYVELKDSLRLLRQEKEIDGIRKSIEYKGRELEIAELKLANEYKTKLNERREQIINLGIFGVCAIFIMTLFLFRSNLKRKKINAELTNSNREKDGMLNMMAHDLKAPLANTQGIVAILTQQGNLEQEQLELLGMINKTVLNGQHLIQGLLELNQLGEKANEDVEFTEIQLVSFVEAKVKEFISVGQKKNIEVLFEGGSSKIINTKPGYLGRIMDNLISNAVKFTPPGGQVKVKTQLEADHFMIFISDTGPGFSDEDKLKMYQNFQRLSALPTGGESSYGLGLAIVKSLVSKLNGTIKLISSPNRGTTFQLRFHVQGDSDL